MSEQHCILMLVVGTISCVFGVFAALVAFTGTAGDHDDNVALAFVAMMMLGAGVAMLVTTFAAGCV